MAYILPHPCNAMARAVPTLRCAPTPRPRSALQSTYKSTYKSTYIGRSTFPGIPRKYLQKYLQKYLHFPQNLLKPTKSTYKSTYIKCRYLCRYLADFRKMQCRYFRGARHATDGVGWCTRTQRQTGPWHIHTPVAATSTLFCARATGKKT